MTKIVMTDNIKLAEVYFGTETLPEAPPAEPVVVPVTPPTKPAVTPNPIEPTVPATPFSPPDKDEPDRMRPYSPEEKPGTPDDLPYFEPLPLTTCPEEDPDDKD